MSRRVAVTGAASGIGRSLAGLLAAQGDTVIGVDLKDAEVCGDLSTRAGRDAAATAVLEQCGGVLDVLVTCAGTSVPSPALVGVNYFGTAELAERLRPALAASAEPRVAAVASITATQPSDADIVAACLDGDDAAALEGATAAMGRGEERLLYPSSKVAVARWLRRTCVAPGWADAGIPLNAVAPGVVRSPMTESLFADPKMREAADAAVPMPLHGHADPVVIAQALRWLVSPENTHATGQVLYVDGGAEAILRGADARP